ncbi:MAG: diaminopimelate epimerase [Candidatus Caenarcaniphilales bacterium]|nr:diaminopimelate epimerase [Candidatus Caenarcaniphilales bacterium]
MSVYILPFEKMHGLGNDFILLHHKYLPPHFTEKQLAETLCNRHFSIGGDGLIIVKPPEDGADFSWSYINSDGSLGEMCGNGIRCFAKYVFDRGLTNKNQFKVETLAGIVEPEIQSNGHIKVNMGSPILLSSEIPVLSENKERVIDQKITVLDKDFNFTAVSMGNPHAIIFLDSSKELEALDLEKYGPVIEKDKHFPKKTNAEFAFIKSRNYIDLRVWERGCGITLACGTGACATVVAANLKGLIDDEPVTVNLPGGELIVEWDKQSNSVFMNGPAQSVFVGQVELEV